MANPAFSPEEIERRLKLLTERQSRILSWICKSLIVKEIAKEIGFGEDLVRAEITQIYKKMGLSGQVTRDKRRSLEQFICPVHLDMLAHPCAGYEPPIIEMNQPEPEPAMINEVKADEQNGLIPLGHTRTGLIWTGTDMPPGRGDTDFMREDFRPFRPKRDPLVAILGVVVGILVTLLGVTLFVLFTQKPVTIAQPATVVATTRPAATQPPQMTPATVPPQAAQAIQPTYTLIPTQIPYTPLPTYTIAPTYTPLPASTRAQVAASPTSSSGLCGTVKLVNQAASEVPGTKLCLNVTVTSIIDGNLKPSDVFALDLIAGQTVAFDVKTPDKLPCVSTYLYNPGTSSIESWRQGTGLTKGCYDWHDTFTPAVSGTYYLRIAAGSRSPQTYTLTINVQ